MNKISHFEELQCQKSLNINQSKLNENLIIWINNVNSKSLIFLKKEVKEFGQQSKSLDCENRRLEHKV